MTPQELADHLPIILAKCQERTLGVGAQRYSDEGEEGRPQRFETMSLDALMEYVEEELLDIVNYSVMVWIRFTRLREAADAAVFMHGDGGRKWDEGREPGKGKTE